MSLEDPFQKIDLTISYVDAVAGSGKTHEAFRVAAEGVRHGGRYIFAMPTLQLISEWFEKCCRTNGICPDIRHRIETITSEDDDDPGPVARRILEFIERQAGNSNGYILFITHAALNLVPEWPEDARDINLIIDEVPEVLLTHKPFKLPNNSWVLRNWIEVESIATTITERRNPGDAPPEFVEFDEHRLKRLQSISDDETAEFSKRRQAAKDLAPLMFKKVDWERWQNSGVAVTTYARLKPTLVTAENIDALIKLDTRIKGKDKDDIYDYIAPIPEWVKRDYLSGDAPVFTHKASWERLTVKPEAGTKFDFRFGTITFIGFRRPDKLKAFQSVTIMSALFEFTMARDVWKSLGVTFQKSDTIIKSNPYIQLGKRTLHIYYLTDDRWTKYLRNRAKGIVNVFELIAKAKVFSRKDQIGIVINKDDDKRLHEIRRVFPNVVQIPHASRGLNAYDNLHKMIYLAALNPYTSDIQWIENVLGIDAEQQRINRTGQEIYQTVNRLSMRKPKSRADVTVIIPEKFIADFVAKQYQPTDQVIVEELPIDTGDMFTHKTRGRKKGVPQGTTPPVSAKERMRQMRARKKTEEKQQ